MNTDTCLCGREAGVTATLADEGGGTDVHLCDRCLTRLDAARCGLCGDRVDDRRGASLYRVADGDLALDVPVCGDCRQRVVHDGGREVAP